MNTTTSIMLVLGIIILGVIAWWFLSSPKAATNAGSWTFSGAGRCYCGNSDQPITVNSQNECAQKCGGTNYTYYPGPVVVVKKR